MSMDGESPFHTTLVFLGDVRNSDRDHFASPSTRRQAGSSRSSSAWRVWVHFPR